MSDHRDAVHNAAVRFTDMPNSGRTVMGCWARRRPRCQAIDTTNSEHWYFG